MSPSPRDEARRIAVVVPHLLAGRMEHAVRHGLVEGFAVSQQGPRDVTFERPTASVSSTGSVSSSGSVTASLRSLSATATVVATPSSAAYLGDARLVAILRRALTSNGVNGTPRTSRTSWFSRLFGR